MAEPQLIALEKAKEEKVALMGEIETYQHVIRVYRTPIVLVTSKVLDIFISKHLLLLTLKLHLLSFMTERMLW